jgi:hypothetical protein
MVTKTAVVAPGRTVEVVDDIAGMLEQRRINGLPNGHGFGARNFHRMRRLHPGETVTGLLSAGEIERLVELGFARFVET